MGTFRTTCRIENPSHRKRFAVVRDLLVDSGSEYTWIPAPVLENIQIAAEKKDLYRLGIGTEPLAVREWFTRS